MGIDIILKVAWQGGDDFHFVPGEVFGEIGVGFGLDDGEVVAVDDMGTDGAGGLDEVAEKLADLRCAAGDVHGLRAVLADPRADLVGDLLGHHFRAVRAGIDVAVGAGLVAFPPDIDLQGLEASPCEWCAVLGEFFLEKIHEERSE